MQLHPAQDPCGCGPGCRCSGAGAGECGVVVSTHSRCHTQVAACMHAFVHVLPHSSSCMCACAAARKAVACMHACMCCRTQSSCMHACVHVLPHSKQLHACMCCRTSCSCSRHADAGFLLMAASHLRTQGGPRPCALAASLSRPSRPLSSTSWGSDRSQALHGAVTPYGAAVRQWHQQTGVTPCRVAVRQWLQQTGAAPHKREGWGD